MPQRDLPKPEVVKLPNGKERLLYRDSEGRYITKEEYNNLLGYPSDPPLGIEESLQKLSIQVPLPNHLLLTEFLPVLRDTFISVDLAYSTFALLYAGQFEVVEELAQDIANVHGDNESVIDELHMHLQESGYEPPKLAYVHYGSDLFTDILGIGKVVEQIVLLIEKTKQWKIQHADQISKDKLLDRELRLKDEEVRKAQIENVKAYLDVIKTARDLSVSDEHLYAIAETASRAIERLYSVSSIEPHDKLLQVGSVDATSDATSAAI